MKCNLKLFLVSILLLGFSGIKAQTDLPSTGEVENFLRKNITVFYIAQPNTESPKITPITGEAVSQDTDGIIFGQKSNNGMDVSAQFLSLLFKKRKTSGDGSDGKFQDMVYYILKISNKPVTLAFVNDWQPIDMKYVEQLRFDTMRNGSRVSVWPTVFEPDAPESAGMIVFGQWVFPDLESMATLFLNLLTHVVMQHYESFYNYIAFQTAEGNPLATNPTARRKINYSFGRSDTRYIIQNAMGAAIAFLYNKRHRGLIYTWFDNPDVLYFIGGEFKGRYSKPIPSEFLISTFLEKENLTKQGYDLTVPPFPPDGANKEFKGFPYKNLPLKIKAKTSCALSVFCDLYLRFNGITAFLEGISNRNSQLLKAPYEKRLAMLIENFCEVKLPGKNLAELGTKPPPTNEYLLPMAYFDMVMGFPENLDAAMFNMIIGANISPVLLTNYLKVRATLKSTAESAQTMSNENIWEARAGAMFRALK